MAKGSTAVYLYCVVKRARRPSLARVPAGLAGAHAGPRRTRLRASLWLITAEVPLDVYGPAQLEPRLRDLDWVSRRSPLAHEAVVEHFSRARGAVVVPDEAVHDVLVDGQGGRRRRRRRGGDRARHEAASPGARSGASASRARPGGRCRTPHGAARPASGAAFLAAQEGRARRGRDSARAAALAAADDGLRALGASSRKDAQQRPRRQEPGTNPPILEAAFLVTGGARARFKAEARRQAALCARRRGRPGADRARGPPTTSSEPRSPREATTGQPSGSADGHRKPSTVPGAHRATRPFRRTRTHVRPSAPPRRRAAPRVATPKPALRAPQAHAAQAARSAGSSTRRVVAARSDRQPAEQGRHAQRGC